jgi:hypothetical protein
MKSTCDNARTFGHTRGAHEKPRGLMVHKRVHESGASMLAPVQIFSPPGGRVAEHPSGGPQHQTQKHSEHRRGAWRGHSALGALPSGLVDWWKDRRQRHVLLAAKAGGGRGGGGVGEPFPAEYKGGRGGGGTARAWHWHGASGHLVSNNIIYLAPHFPTTARCYVRDSITGCYCQLLPCPPCHFPLGIATAHSMGSFVFLFLFLFLIFFLVWLPTPQTARLWPCRAAAGRQT